MAIVTCIEIWEARTATKDDKNIRRYTRAWEVRTNNQNDGPLTAGSHASIPAIGATYNTGTETDTWAKVIRIDPKQSSEDPTLWRVDVDYSSDPGEAFVTGPADAPTTGTPNENPLSRPAKYTCNSKVVQRFLPKDKNNNAYKNSAGEPFENPPATEEGRLLITIEKNYADISYADIAGWLNKVNTDAGFLNGAGVRTLKVIDAGAGPAQTENGVTFVPVRVTIEYNPDLWIPTLILDAGHRYLNAAGKLVEAIGDTGDSFSGPVLLDGTGHKLGAGDPPVYLEFVEYDEMDFGDNLPS